MEVAALQAAGFAGGEHPFDEAVAVIGAGAAADCDTNADTFSCAAAAARSSTAFSPGRTVICSGSSLTVAMYLRWQYRIAASHRTGNSGAGALCVDDRLGGGDRAGGHHKSQGEERVLAGVCGVPLNAGE